MGRGYRRGSWCTSQNWSITRGRSRLELPKGNPEGNSCNHLFVVNHLSYLVFAFFRSPRATNRKSSGPSELRLVLLNREISICLRGLNFLLGSMPRAFNLNFLRASRTFFSLFRFGMVGWGSGRIRGGPLFIYALTLH